MISYLVLEILSLKLWTDSKHMGENWIMGVSSSGQPLAQVNANIQDVLPQNTILMSLDPLLFEDIHLQSYKP